MANQPKKYKKFVATAATATLVASAIVPVASAAGFSDVAENNSHAEAINALVEAGIIKGFEDGTFGPNKELTRGHVVKMLGKWVEAQGFAIPADYNTVQRFDDVAVDAADQELVKYAALVKDTGVFVGSEGDLNAADSITRENMALTLDRAYKAVFGKSIVELAAGSTNLTVSDLALAKEEAREEIQALRNLGISNVDTFNPKNTVTRGQFASFLNRTIEADAPATETGAIKSLTATGVKELTVEFKNTVDTKAAKITVTKGSTSVVVSDVEWNIDNNVAVLTLGSKLVDGTYTVSVEGIASEAVTATVTTKAEVATSIQVSPYLVLTGKQGVYNGTSLDTAVVKFAVLNQYGEDITTTLPSGNFDIKVKSVEEHSVLQLSDKRVLVYLDEDTDEGDTGSITVEYEDDNKDIELSATQEITVSEEIVIDTTEIHGIYSASGKALTSDNLKKAKDRRVDEFYLKLKAFNQYGSEITNVDELKATLEDVSFDVSEDNLFDLPKLTTTLIDTDVLFQTIDGEKYVLIPLDVTEYEDNTYGENTVTVESDTNKETSATFTVEEADAIVDVQLGSVDKTITGGSEVKIPVNAYNQAGELVVDAGELEDLTKGEKPDLTIDIDENPSYKFTEENGQVYLVFDAPVDPDNESYELEITVEFDNEVYDSEYEYVYNVEPKSEVNAITLYDEDTYFFDNGTTAPTIDVNFDDFEIEDQFGNEYDGSEYTIELKDDELPQNVSPVTGRDADVSFVIDQGESATLDFVLKNADGQKVDEYSVTFRNVGHDQFASYAVEKFDAIYSDEDQLGTYAQEVKVYGVLGNGVEVELPVDEYSISTSGAIRYDDTTNKLYAKTGKVDTDSNTNIPSSAEGTYTAVINNDNGDEVKSQSITLSADAPEAAEIAFVDSDDDVLSTIEVDLTNATSIDLESLFDNLDASDDFYVLDSYGLEDWFRPNDDSDAEVLDGTATVDWDDYYNGSNVNSDDESSDVKLTFSDFDTDLFKVSANGSSNATLSVKDAEEEFQAGDSFKVKVTIDGVSTTVTVFVR